MFPMFTGNGRFSETWQQFYIQRGRISMSHTEKARDAFLDRGTLRSVGHEGGWSHSSSMRAFKWDQANVGLESAESASGLGCAPWVPNPRTESSEAKS